MKKKETQEQNIKRIFDESLSNVTKHEISNCSFVGVQFDAKAVDAITAIAKGLQINAQALGDLAAVLKAGNVEIETMMRVDG